MKRYILNDPRSESFKVPLNFVLYNLSWVIGVLGASRGSAYPGVISAIVAVCVHLLLLAKSWRQELKFIAAAVAVGSVLDSPLSIMGYVTFAANRLGLFGTYPIWMSALWAGFATTLSLSLRWIKVRYALGALFGALGGPASLYAGSRLGAATFNGNEISILVFNAIAWSALIPIILFLHKKITL